MWYFEVNCWFDVSIGLKEVECKLKFLKRKVMLSVKILFDLKIIDNIKNKYFWIFFLYKGNRRMFSKF